jgi:single-strand DNA-binding protein
MAKSNTVKSPQQETPAPKESTFRHFNRVQLAGRLVSDPDLRYTPSGKAVCKLRLATNDTQTAQFHDIVAWEELGETAAQALTKGATAIVEGRLQNRSWQTPDGSPRRVTEIVAASITF